MKKTFWYQISILSFAILVLSGLSSCNKEETPDQPQLPPIESMIMDFSDFDQTPSTTKGITTVYDNFINAYVNVAFWTTVSGSAVIIPAVAYHEMLTNSGGADYMGDNIWVWTRTFTHTSQSYTATLTAVRLNNDQFSMVMEIATSEYPDQGVVWFDGVIRYDHTHAIWNFYRYDEGQVKMLEVEWNKNFETGVSDLKYTYVEPGTAEYGSYIIFGIDPAKDYDAYYTISMSENTINIEWDRETKAGRIKNPAYFEDTDWHCWNNMLENIVCPVN